MDLFKSVKSCQHRRPELLQLRRVRLGCAFVPKLPEKRLQLVPVACLRRRKELFNLSRHTDIQFARYPMKHIAPGARELGRSASYNLFGRFNRKCLGTAGMQSWTVSPLRRRHRAEIVPG